MVLAHWNNSSQVQMSLHFDTLAWFQTNQYLPLLINAACLVEKQQIPISIFGWTWLGFEPMVYHTRGKHANYYTTDAVHSFYNKYSFKNGLQI
jgi:hypothetical protein